MHDHPTVRPDSWRRTSGLTFVELIAVMAIITVLGALIVAAVSRLPGAGDRARCSTNLRNLHLALDSYTKENEHWPQQPDFSASQQEQYADWWITTLKPYGMTTGTWQCPALVRLGKIQAQGQTPRVHYSPTMFDAGPQTPYKWPGQPWVIEIANVHGRGALLIFPDGSVRDLEDVLAEAEANKGK